MNEHDNDNNGEGGPPLMALESLDHYIRRHGLANGDPQAGGEFNGLNRVEAIEQIRLEEAYRDTVIEEYEAQQQGDDGTPAPSDDPRPGNYIEGDVIRVLLANHQSPHYLMPVQPLVSLCETVQRMVASRHLFRGGVDDSVGGVNCAELCCADAVTIPSRATGGDKGSRPIMELSLIEFASDAVVQFLALLVSLYDRRQKEALTLTKDPALTRKRRINSDADNSTIYKAIDEGTLSEEHIVEYLKLAHFLQCHALEKPLVSIVQLSIDSSNCMAICSLADALNLKPLFEASVHYVIERLDVIQGTSSSLPDDNCTAGGGVERKRAAPSSALDEDEGADCRETRGEIWASLPHELRARVLTMRNVMRSSVIGRGSRASGLFFSDASEFLAIFREAIADQKERLAEATERREEVVCERVEEWRTMRRRRGQRCAATAAAEHKFVYGTDVMYALDKIVKQSRRLETLESFYEEQRLIFREGGFESEILL